ncbi:MAG: cytochrome C [Sphingobacteriia bacterium]|nr:cytochrome C [Sphingobacteriia bacterium]NCC38476.1 cytochrome C [Gammaproteobacteria bacterium]
MSINHLLPNRHWLMLLALTSTLVSSGLQAETPIGADAAIAAPETLAHPCAGCHGTNGWIDDSAFMPLAGMPESIFIETMLDFREERRASTLMGMVAQGYSDAEIQAMARFFVNQPSEGTSR